MMDHRSRIMRHRCRIVDHIIWSVHRRSPRKIGCGIRRMIRRRTRNRHGSRPPMIHRRKLIPVDAGIMLLRHLRRSSLHMPVMRSSLFRRTRPRSDPARPAIITDPVDGRIVYDRAVNIGIVDDGGVDVDHRRIIPEMTTYPITAGKSRTVVPASIVDSAIEADVRPPITCIPCIDPADITPVTGRP